MHRKWVQQKYLEHSSYFLLVLCPLYWWLPRSSMLLRTWIQSNISRQNQLKRIVEVNIIETLSFMVIILPSPFSISQSLVKSSFYSIIIHCALTDEENKTFFEASKRSMKIKIQVNFHFTTTLWNARAVRVKKSSIYYCPSLLKKSMYLRHHDRI